MKQFTLTKEEFITRSMAGEVFISVEYGSRFHYDNTKTMPFRLGNDTLDQAWRRLDGYSLFTLEQPKPRIERRWKWRQDSKGYTKESSYIYLMIMQESTTQKMVGTR